MLWAHVTCKIGAHLEWTRERYLTPYLTRESTYFTSVKEIAARVPDMMFESDDEDDASSSMYINCTPSVLLWALHSHLAQCVDPVDSQWHAMWFR